MATDHHLPMKLSEALQITQSATSDVERPLRVELACGFTALHLETFLAAHLQLANADRTITLTTGLYGDGIGNIERALATDADLKLLVLEWTDLDPRLGIRRLGGWGPSQLDDIRQTVLQQIARLKILFSSAKGSARVVVSLPTLALPPVDLSTPEEVGELETSLYEAVDSLASALVATRGIHVVSREHLNRLSPQGNRFDLKSELAAGFPYRLGHAEVLARIMAQLASPVTPKKGIITDLDDTLWRGILGDVGPDQVYWDLDHHGQMHGVYQQMLHALAEVGVLVAVASRNDIQPVEEVFQRKDMLLPRDVIFPLEVHWGAKSDSIGHILDAWNVGPEAVVFIDDSSMELAQVQSVYPAIECLQFTPDDDEAAYELCFQLRTLLGKSRLTEEDALRAGSLRRAQSVNRSATGDEAGASAFLRGLDGSIALSCESGKITHGAAAERVLELVNKTNQFNLNGRRYLESEWSQALTSDESFLVVAEYHDKFGSLGRISVLSGILRDKTLNVSTWVLSCRAFARRIEHSMLAEVFRRLAVDRIVFDFKPTDRNGPLQEFFTQLLEASPTDRLTLTAEQFAKACPERPHQMNWTSHV